MQVGGRLQAKGVRMEDGRTSAYRLPRHDYKRALQPPAAPFFNHPERKVVAGQLHRARPHLRDLVDEIDLQAMGEEA